MRRATWMRPTRSCGAPDAPLDRAPHAQREFAHPLEGRVGIAVAVPLQGLLQRGHFERRRPELDGQHFFGLQCQALVHGGNAVGADHHLRQGRHAGRRHLDLALDAEAVEKPAVERRALLARGVVRDDMAAFEIVVERQFLADAAVAVPGHAQVLLLEQRRAGVVDCGELRGNDQQVGVALLELFYRLVVERAQLQAYAARLLVERFEQRRNEHRGGEVRQQQHKGARGLRGVEQRRRGDRAVDAHQHVAHRLDQPQRARREHHLPALRGQQLVAKEVAQARQRIAHRRLAQVQALTRAADVAFGQQRVQRHQQIQIEFIEAHVFEWGRAAIGLFFNGLPLGLS